MTSNLNTTGTVRNTNEEVQQNTFNSQTMHVSGFIPLESLGRRHNGVFCTLISILLLTIIFASMGLVVNILIKEINTLPEADIEFQTNKDFLRFNTIKFSQQSQNAKQKVVIFFGTRPEIIKLAPVIKVFKKSKYFSAKTVFTGQHADIMQPFLDVFDIQVDVWFNKTFTKGQSLSMFVGKLFMETEQLVSNKEDIWIIQGDTTSALVIAMVAFYRQIRIAHVEAGLRTHNLYNPFPEEFNRRTISSVATYHFAPTKKDQENLLAEGINKSHIFVTGNTAIDSIIYIHTTEKLQMPKELSERNVEFLILITLHRRENIHKFEKFYRAIASVQCPKCIYIVPVHPNPHASEAAMQICHAKSDFICVPPLPYEKMHWVLNNSRLIITDSGGIQEEATYYNIPTLILRKHSERDFENLNDGLLTLVDELSLPSYMERVIQNDFKGNYSKTSLFGDGNASQIIHDTIRKFYLPLM